MGLSMKVWEGKVAIVTGASRGIGAVLAQELVKLGLVVVGLARRKELMDSLAEELKNESGKLYPIKCDITKESEILEAFAWIKVNLGPVSILINNAGLVRNGLLIEGDATEWSTHLSTDILGLCICTREAVKNMRANGVDGHIIHINGISGHYVPKLVGINILSAIKHAVTALTETLRQELVSIKSKIKITSISPGLVSTPVLKELSSENDGDIFNSIEGFPQLSPKDVADAVVYVLSTPPHVQVHELMIRPVGEVF